MHVPGAQHILIPFTALCKGSQPAAPPLMASCRCWLFTRASPLQFRSGGWLTGCDSRGAHTQEGVKMHASLGVKRDAWSGKVWLAGSGLHMNHK